MQHWRHRGEWIRVDRIRCLGQPLYYRSGQGTMIEEKDVKVRMRDGVDIGLRIYRPDGSGRYPALFAASPYRYDNNLLPCSPLFLWRETGPVEWYVEEQGYAEGHVLG